MAAACLKWATIICHGAIARNLPYMYSMHFYTHWYLNADLRWAYIIYSTIQGLVKATALYLHLIDLDHNYKIQQDGNQINKEHMKKTKAQPPFDTIYQLHNITPQPSMTNGKRSHSATTDDRVTFASYFTQEDLFHMPYIFVYVISTVVVFFCYGLSATLLGWSYQEREREKGSDQTTQYYRCQMRGTDWETWDGR